MGPIFTPLAAARAGTRLLGGVVHLATLPARTAARLGFGAAETVLDLLEHNSPEQRQMPYGRPWLREQPPGVARRPNGGETPVVPIRPLPPAAATRRQATPAPAHVAAEATLVAESADAGADGAGASVRVAAPWPRYGRMSAAEILDRLTAQEEAVISLVLLYERSHRARRSVIDAAERALVRRASPAHP